MVRKSILLTVTGITVAGFLAYAVYFDYKRRHDGQFRKRLRKEKKLVNKTRASEAASHEISPEELRLALEKVKKEKVPSGKQQEDYFMGQVNMGEQLGAKGPSHALQAALCFYRALRIYPAPLELVLIYQKTVPEPIFKIVVALTELDARAKIEGYYEVFPPKSMNVSTTTVVESGKDIGRRVLVAAKDFAAGELIYKEQPVVTVLDFDLEGRGTHCSYCLRTIKKGSAIFPPSDRLSSAYCSKECHAEAKIRHQDLLFTSNPPHPASPPVPAPSMGERVQAQEAFVAHLKKSNKAFSLLTSRFIARQVTSELLKMMPGLAMPPADLPQADENEYTINDHMERLRYLDLTVPEEETNMVRNVLRNALPGLESILADERHAILLGKISYNSYGVCHGKGRDDRPTSREQQENQEKTRTPFGTERQVGSAFYLVSSYIGHSCDPSARPSFPQGTAELHLIANRAIKKNEMITVAYTDVSTRAGETPVLARQRRRRELARGWRFACMCERCIAEGAEQVDGKDNDVHGQKDESRVENVVEKLQSQQGPR